jgi:nucleoside-diphosphate-sugar epimerase
VLEIVAEIAAVMGVPSDPRILDTASMEIRDQTLDASKARARLGWTARWSIADGLAETVRWYREHLSRSATNIPV